LHTTTRSVFFVVWQRLYW